MVFFPNETTSPSKTIISDLDKELANKLITVIAIKGNLKRRPNKIQWAKDIHSLADDLSLNYERLQKVLDWYIANLSYKYAPWVWSARSFRDKFPQIEAVMNRHVSNATKIRITRTAIKIVEDLNFYWAKEREEDLIPVVQASLDEYQKFLDFIELYMESKPAIPKMLFKQHLSSPSCFVAEWISTRIEKWMDWQEWSQDPKTLQFKIQSKEFQRNVYLWCSEFTPNRQRVNRFMEALRNADRT